MVTKVPLTNSDDFGELLRRLGGLYPVIRFVFPILVLGSGYRFFEESVDLFGVGGFSPFYIVFGSLMILSSVIVLAAPIFAFYSGRLDSSWTQKAYESRRNWIYALIFTIFFFHLISGFDDISFEVDHSAPGALWTPSPGASAFEKLLSLSAWAFTLILLFFLSRLPLSVAVFRGSLVVFAFSYILVFLQLAWVSARMGNFTPSQTSVYPLLCSFSFLVQVASISYRNGAYSEAESSIRAASQTADKYLASARLILLAILGLVLLSLDIGLDQLRARRSLSHARAVFGDYTIREQLEALMERDAFREMAERLTSSARSRQFGYRDISGLQENLFPVHWHESLFDALWAEEYWAQDWLRGQRLSFEEVDHRLEVSENWNTFAEISDVTEIRIMTLWYSREKVSLLGHKSIATVFALGLQVVRPDGRQWFHATDVLSEDRGKTSVLGSRTDIQALKARHWVSRLNSPETDLVRWLKSHPKQNLVTELLRVAVDARVPIDTEEWRASDTPSALFWYLEDRLINRSFSVPVVGLLLDPVPALWSVSLIILCFLLVTRNRLRTARIKGTSDIPWLILDARRGAERLLAFFWIAALILGPTLANYYLLTTFWGTELIAGNVGHGLRALGEIVFVIVSVGLSSWTSLAIASILFELRNVRGVSLEEEANLDKVILGSDDALASDGVRDEEGESENN